MYRARVIPCLLISGNGLVKTKKFKDPVYIGDPVNAVRIFSDKEADELMVLDINASREQREPNYELIAEIAGEAFMPIAYGGGIRNLSQVRRLIRCGIEKVVLNTVTAESTHIIGDISRVFGSQAVIGAVDIRRNLFGRYTVVVQSGNIATKLSLIEHIQSLVTEGVGEICINSVDSDGTMEGYDLELIRTVSQKVSVPVIALGGAGTREHLSQAILAGASAVSAGSMFVFHGKHRAVLISYPNDIKL